MARRVSEQWAIAVVALALWNLDPRASLLSLLVAYAMAWLALSIVRALRPAWLEIPLSRLAAIGLAVLVAAPAAVQLARLRGRFVENEEAVSLDHHLEWRTRLELPPVIAPPLVSGDLPQTFYVHAPGARRVSVRFGRRPIAARALGHGLFRLEYDPRVHGRPSPASGSLRAVIDVDGEAHGRAMEATRALAHPRWLVPSPDRTMFAAVSEETDELFVLDANGLRQRVRVGDGPTDARFAGDAIVVSHRYGDELLWVRARDGRFLRRKRIGPFAHRMAIDPSGEHLAVALHGERPRIVIVRASDGHQEAESATSFRADWLAFGADASRLIASRVRPAALRRFRVEDGAIVNDGRALTLGRPAVTMARAMNGARVVIALTDYRPDGLPHTGNHFVQDQLLTIDVDRWAVIDRRMTAIRSQRQISPGDVDRGGSPIGIDALDDGRLVVAFVGTDEAWVLADEGEPQILDLAREQTPAPSSAILVAGDRIAVSSPSFGTIGIYERRGRLLHLERFAPDDDALMRHDQAALQCRIGERMFYESTRSGISCQSCHLHGASDGGKHNIGGYELLATLDVRGILGTPPYLRDGSYPRLMNFDDMLAEALLRDYRRDQPGRRASLERYLGSLPRPTPPRQLERRDRERERRGLDLFVRASCPMCHALPAFTNLGQHPTVSIFPSLREHAFEADTPSLLSLGETAPYMSDGRAEAIESIFREHDPDHRHGDTSGLDDREMDDLVYFLEGL